MIKISTTKKSIETGAEASVMLDVDDSIAQDAAVIAALLASALIELQDGKEFDEEEISVLVEQLKQTQRLRIFADHASALIELQDGKEFDEEEEISVLVEQLKQTQRLRIFADHMKIMEKQLVIAYEALNDIHEAEDGSAKWERADQALYRMRLAAQGR